MGLLPPDLCSLCPLSSTEFVEPPEQNSWVRQCPGRRVAGNIVCSCTLSHVAIWPEDANNPFSQFAHANLLEPTDDAWKLRCVAVSSLLGASPKACSVYYAVLLSGSK